jgi:hypothetical protein
MSAYSAESPIPRQCSIDSGPRMDSDKVKVVMVKDPDGNSIAFAQAIDPSIAH